MPNDPLGISFSPFSQQNQQQAQTPGTRSVTPQDAIRILSFRPPRTVGAASPIPGALLNAPGGAAFGGGGQFGAAGGNLEQLLALLFGQGRMNTGGGGGFNESPAMGQNSPLPWEQAGPAPWQGTPPVVSKTPPPFFKPGQGEQPNNAPLPGGTAGPDLFGPMGPVGRDRFQQ